MVEHCPELLDTTEQDLQRILMHAASTSAEHLREQGIEAWSNGPDLCAKVGRYTCIMRNHITRGEPGNRERMLDTFARTVVNNLLKSNPEIAKPG